eukprot:1153004-Pelagomonas_calceolata.AAC.1
MFMHLRGEFQEGSLNRLMMDFPAASPCMCSQTVCTAWGVQCNLCHVQVLLPRCLNILFLLPCCDERLALLVHSFILCSTLEDALAEDALRHTTIGGIEDAICQPILSRGQFRGSY